MSRETGRKKKRKKKSKFGYYLYAVVILILTITNITLATLLLTYVQGIQVTGTKYSQQDEIVTWIEEDFDTKNSLYMLYKFKVGSYKLPTYLKDVKVSLSAPWKVKVAVTEKKVVGCLINDDSYVYFDEEGLVLQKSTKYEESIPIIEGIQTEKAEKYKVLQVDDKKIFERFVSITKELEEYELSPDRFVWEDDSMNLYFEQICVQLGKSNFDEKVLQLPPILEKLVGKTGTLHLEHYTTDSTNISFEENIEENLEENY